MLKISGKFIAVCCSAVALIAGGCTDNQKTDAEIEQLRSYTEQRFNDLQAHLTVLSEQIDRDQVQPVTLAPTTASRATPSLGTEPVVQITDIEPIGISSLSRKQAIAQLSQPVPAHRSSTKAKRKKTSKKSSSKKYAKIIRVSGVSSRDVQSALKNAGFNPGKVDGVIGPNTVKAIKMFQSAEKLKADGIVGKMTWNKLSPHLASAAY